MSDQIHILQARVHELELEVAKLKRPDMFWEANNPETGGQSVKEIVDNVLDWVDGDTRENDVIVTIQAARSLPDFFAASLPAMDGDDKYERFYCEAPTVAECQKLLGAERNHRAALADNAL